MFRVYISFFRGVLILLRGWEFVLILVCVRVLYQMLLLCSNAHLTNNNTHWSSNESPADTFMHVLLEIRDYIYRPLFPAPNRSPRLFASRTILFREASSMRRPVIAMSRE